jgi:RNA polymerase sigma factor (sigma-70 family)
MATNPKSEILQHLRGAVLSRDGAGLSDGQLLRRFVEGRDDAAFAALVRRHGPLVWGTVRRVLGNHHDAEDAFQATFLVLARKAASVVPRELLANWLYGVAHQTALHARRTAYRRGARERQVATMPEPAAAEQELWRDLQPLLDQELSRLPDKYRAVVVLCDLEGKTRADAAGQLGLPPGTVGSRLARARALLARRLAPHGLAVSGGSLAAVLSQKAASAGVPPSLATSLMTAASRLAAGQAAAPVAALAEGVLKAMLLNKLKGVAAVLLLAAVIGLGAGGRLHRAPAAGPAARHAALLPVLLAQKADGQEADPWAPHLGFYWADKRLIGAQKQATASKARARAFAKLQLQASVEASLKKFMESTDEKGEREALDRIGRAVLRYKDTQWLIELLWVEEEAVPFPGERKPGAKKK